MKGLRLSVALVLLALAALPAGAAGLTAEELDIGGIRVLLRRNPDTPVVSAVLGIRGGSQNLTPAQAGLELLALTTATEGGTRSLDREQFARALASLGSELAADARLDFSFISLRCVRPNLEKTWDLFAQALLEPRFDPASFELFRRRQMARLREEEEDPDRLLVRLSQSIYYSGHPYSVRPLGSPETLPTFTAPQAADYYRGLLTRERLFLAVVGDVDRPTLEALVRSSLLRLPSGPLNLSPLQPITRVEASVHLERREIPTRYVFGLFPAPPPGDPDYPALALALEVLSDRLFVEVRTRRNLSYAVSSRLLSYRSNAGYYYFTSTRPNETMDIFRAEIRRLQEEPLSPQDLEEYRRVFITDYWMSRASGVEQATSLVAAEMVAGDWTLASRFIDELQRVTPARVQEVARRYLGAARFVVLGDPQGVDVARFRL